MRMVRLESHRNPVGVHPQLRELRGPRCAWTDNWDDAAEVRFRTARAGAATSFVRPASGRAQLSGQPEGGRGEALDSMREVGRRGGGEAGQLVGWGRPRPAWPGLPTTAPARAQTYAGLTGVSRGSLPVRVGTPRRRENRPRQITAVPMAPINSAAPIFGRTRPQRPCLGATVRSAPPKSAITGRTLLISLATV
jgi:hypothetical protein